MTVAAGPIANVCVLAVVAPFDHAAQHPRPAGLDGLHQAMLMQRQRVGLPVPGPCCRKMSANSRVGSAKVYDLGLPLLGRRALRSRLSSGLTVVATTCGLTWA